MKSSVPHIVNTVYFDLFSQKKAWKDHGKNKESLAELWVGMLRFYTEEFNFKDYVICIRQLAPLTRFEKLWNGKCLAIEGNTIFQGLWVVLRLVVGLKGLQNFLTEYLPASD